MRKRKGFELQNVCNEYLLIPTGVENIDFSKIISLNETAAYLWNNIPETEPFTVETVAELLIKEYEVEEEIALEDSRLIAESFIESGIAEE